MDRKEEEPPSAWRLNSGRRSIPEAFGSIPVPKGTSWVRRLLAFAGPGCLVAVGYMDPGNWATDISGGASYQYRLLSVILLSNFLAVFLQALSAKLGIVTGRDLAQACHDAYSRPVVILLWLSAELGIIACDVAEVLGAAIALNLLFHVPLVLGVLLTACDVLVVLLLQGRSFRWIEFLVFALILLMTAIFAIELSFSHPDLVAVAKGLIPGRDIIMDPKMLFIALGILGATVMPHNLYLHSAIIQTRAFGRSAAEIADSIRLAVVDSTVALTLALFVNAAILILASDAFFRTGHHEVGDIQQAYQLLTPLLGAALATPLFAIALLASGQNSTLTGTMAGQIIMEGFVELRIPPWARRLVSRCLAILPSLVAVGVYGEAGTGRLLILSQVVLSMQLPFAVIPLVQFTSNPAKMGSFVNGPIVKFLGWAAAVVIVILNGYLLVMS
jgi:manganese transport protein